MITYKCLTCMAWPFIQAHKKQYTLVFSIFIYCNIYIAKFIAGIYPIVSVFCVDYLIYRIKAQKLYRNKTITLHSSQSRLSSHMKVHELAKQLISLRVVIKFTRNKRQSALFCFTVPIQYHISWIKNTWINGKSFIIN